MTTDEEHPDLEYNEALAEVDALAADKKEEAEAGEAPEAPTVEGDAWDPAEGAPEGNPILRAPMLPDGGENEGDNCPHCNEPMEPAGSGIPIQGVRNGEAIEGTTEEGDEFCPECDVLRPASGGTIWAVDKA